MGSLPGVRPIKCAIYCTSRKYRNVYHWVWAIFLWNASNTTLWCLFYRVILSKFSWFQTQTHSDINVTLHRWLNFWIENFSSRQRSHFHRRKFRRNSRISTGKSLFRVHLILHVNVLSKLWELNDAVKITLPIMDSIPHRLWQITNVKVHSACVYQISWKSVKPLLRYIS